MSADACPVVIVGGYLGAGKTTLVNHLLRHAGGRRLGVLVNDFGSISVDAALIEGQGDDGVLAIAGGCVCCAYGADLVGTLAQVVRRVPKPDLVLVECSGVGLPAAVARSAALVREARVEGLVTLVDAADVARLAVDAYVGDTVCRQIAESDLLLINHADRLSPLAWSETQSLLERLAPGVVQLGSEFANVPAEVVLGLRPMARRRLAAAGGITDLTSGSAAAPKKMATAARQFRFFEEQVPQAVDPAQWISALVARHPRLLRAKGWVAGTDGRTWRVQAMGRRCVAEPEPPESPARTSTVVCIAALEK